MTRPSAAVWLWVLGALTACGGCPPTSNQPDASVVPDAGSERPGFVALREGLLGAALSVSARGPQDVWACGARGEGVHPMLLHGTAGGWTDHEVPVDADLWWLHRLADGGLVVVGSASTILVVDPSAGTVRGLSGGGTDQLYGVWGTSLQSLWVVGANQQGAGVLWRVNGSTGTIDAVTLDEATPALLKVWGRSAQDVFVSGDLGTVWHYDGAGWTRDAVPTTQRLVTIHGHDQEVAVAGGDAQAYVFVRDAAGAWTEHAFGGFFALTGMAVGPAGTMLAAGNGGAVYVREDGVWRAVDEMPVRRDWHGAAIDDDGGWWVSGGLLGGVDQLHSGAVLYAGAGPTVPAEVTAVTLRWVGGPDAGPPVDGGTTLDAGPADAGAADAGPADGGRDAGPADAHLDAGGAPDAGFDFGPPAPPLSDEPSMFAVALGDVATNFTFTPWSPGDTTEIVQGPQGGIHVEVGAQATVSGPPGAVTADVFGRVLIEGADVAMGTYSAVTLLEVAPGVYQTGELLLIFETDLAGPYTGWPALVEVLVDVDGTAGYVSHPVTLIDAF